MLKRRLLNDGWTFAKHPLGTTLDTVDRQRFAPVDVPHDWLIYDAQNLYETGEGWYRRVIEGDDLAGLRVLLRFEGVYMDSYIYVNGVCCGEWKYGYSTFEVDIGGALVQGDNEILVQVVHQAPNSRWYSGAGIYRSVWLITTGANYIASDGVYITPRAQEDGTWLVEVDTEMHVDGMAKPQLRHTIFGPDGQAVAWCEGDVGPARLWIEAPLLWNVDAPHLYMLSTQLLDGMELVGTVENTFGLRTTCFGAEEGFFLNGRPLKLYGVCHHHDLGSLGAAVNRQALRRQLTMLRQMGVNAIRTSHNMPAVELMELADEMGFLVCSEAFDMWERAKTTYDYARFFPTWAERDVASWVRRDRNHPSVIMWSIGNEIADTHVDARGQEITVMLRDWVRQHDPKGHAPVTIGSNYMAWENAQKCADLVDLAGYNYAEYLYPAHHAAHPGRILYGSETSSTVQSRGIYHFPLRQSLLADDDLQCSSLGNSTTSWGAANTEYCITKDRDAAYSLGQFIWTGFDYIGEPTPYHTKNSYFGQIDTAGFQKDSFYIYQAAWTDCRTAPMVHLFPYWDFSPGQMIDVRACTNAPRVELFVNDVSQGAVDIDHAHGARLLGEWQVPYVPGVLRAVAYDAAGNVIAMDEQRSFGEGEQIVLHADKDTLQANGEDLIFVEISLVDGQGTFVANAVNRMSVAVEGAGRLVGLDNGDSTDWDSYKGTSRRLFSGRLLAVIAATFAQGPITCTVTSPGLAPQQISLQAVEAPIREGIANTFTRNDPSEAIEELPVRKIELPVEGGFALGPDRKQVSITAVLHPADATYRDVQWRLTNQAGIDTNIATLQADGLTATITALGDGEITLRCMGRNGAEHARVMAQQTFTIAGLGDAYLDPYTFVSAGLYNASNVPMANGNDRGVATLREAESQVGFRGVDFGPFGSDEITLPIFAMEAGAFPIEIWEGMPGEPSAALVDTVTYTQGSEWNTYKPQTFTLPRRLTGITTLVFVVRRKIHIKGFVFKAPQQAFAPVAAAAYTAIYGDAYTIEGTRVTGIGNNVSIAYGSMDFGDATQLQLAITGRTPLDSNDIRLVLEGEDGPQTHALTFRHAVQDETQTFPIAISPGAYTVTFLFLPGSQFDFAAFQFSRA